jgi:ADP-ribose pyrophosphatase YjhB (NUDIX family)
MSTVEYTAAGGVIIDQGRMLLLDRPSRQEVRLPKGHVEDGEDVACAALRETAEETGLADLAIAADLGRQVVEFEHQGAHYRRTEHYFLLRKTGDGQQPRPPKDAEQFRPFWAPVSEAAALLTYPAEQDVARKAIAAAQAGNPAVA